MILKQISQLSFIFIIFCGTVSVTLLSGTKTKYRETEDMAKRIVELEKEISSEENINLETEIFATLRKKYSNTPEATALNKAEKDKKLALKKLAQEKNPLLHIHCITLAIEDFLGENRFLGIPRENMPIGIENETIICLDAITTTKRCYEATLDFHEQHKDEFDSILNQKNDELHSLKNQRLSLLVESAYSD